MGKIDWALLARYAAGECDPDEQALVMRRLEEEPRYQEALRVIRGVTIQARLAVPSAEEEECVARLSAKLAATTPFVATPPRVTPWRRRSPLLKVAAAVMLVVAGSIAGYAVLRQPTASLATAPTVHTTTTLRGQHISLALADGTKIILAPASTLRVPASYGVRDRTVELDGEAMFTVIHDERRPFRVRSGTLTAEDLGTRFVVRTYPDDPSADVVVAEGEVAVTSTAGRGGRTVLVTGDRAQVVAGGGLTVSHGVPLDTYFGWTEGRLVFRGAPLQDAIVQLARWYDVEIRLASTELGGRRFSAAFPQDQTASQILGAVATALRLDLEQTGPRRYTLRTESGSTTR